MQSKITLSLIATLTLAPALFAQGAPPPTAVAAAAPAAPVDACRVREITELKRNPTPWELRCRYGAQGPGKFGLLSYLDVPVYQPVTPLPGTHVVGVPGMPHPRQGESYEHWEWRILRTSFGREVQTVHRGTDLLDPVFLSKILRFERELRARGVRARRRETWRSPERQAWLFQRGRARPGPFATTTLTSWHCRVDRLGRPAARAADNDVAGSQLARFHQVAAEIGLESYGADSNDPGHVYLPDTDAATGMEIAVLRLVPRVMHVTLATGRPEGEPQPPGAPARWYRLAQEFIAAPFAPHPAAEPRTARAAPAVRPTAVTPKPPPPALAEPPRRGRRKG